MRPTFTTVIPLSQEYVSRKLSEELTRPERRATSLVFDGYFELHVPDSEIRYWSPHLSLTLDGDTRQTVVVGRFAPRQNVWTLVWILYLFLAFTLFFSLIYAYAHWILRSSTWVTLLVPLSVVGILMLYVISQIGQSWSSDQMTSLRANWHELVEKLFPPGVELEHDALVKVPNKAIES
jgi:uncharacterized membrane protein